MMRVLAALFNFGIPLALATRITARRRPIAMREAILACRYGGTASVMGEYGGFIDRFPRGAVPMGAIRNRLLTIRSGQCHVQRYTCSYISIPASSSPTA